MDNANSFAPSEAVKPDPKASSSVVNRLLLKTQEGSAPNAASQLNQVSNIQNRIGSQAGGGAFSTRVDTATDQIQTGGLVDSAKQKFKAVLPYIEEGAKQGAILGVTAVNPAAGRAMAVADKFGAFDKKPGGNFGLGGQEQGPMNAKSDEAPEIEDSDPEMLDQEEPRLR